MAEYGKDGKIYDTWSQKEAADARYEQHQEQKRLLEEQNYLIAEQAKMNERLAKEKMIHDMVERDRQKDMQLKQMEHEKEMRILKLFDAAGLNNSVYNDFIFNLFGDSVVNLINKIDKNRKNSEELKSTIEFMTERVEDSKEFEKYFYDIYVKTLGSTWEEHFKEKEKLEIKEKLERCLDDTSTVQERLDVGNYLRKQDFDDLEDNKTSGAGICLVLAVVIGFICLLFEHPGLGLLIMLFGFFLAAILAMIKSDNMRRANFLYHAEIALKDINDSILLYKKECKKSLLEELKKKKNKLKELEETKKEFKNILPRWEKFIEFRKKHYNSKIENILIETGVKELILKLGFDYPKINSSNKIKNGTIEDYITYFDEFGN